VKRILKIGAIAAALLFVILIALPFLINVNSFRPKIESEMTTALGRQVTVGNLSLSFHYGEVAQGWRRTDPACLLEAVEHDGNQAGAAPDHAAKSK
jgi:uncharacterized protein involved in outer membrane biogenesis